MSMWVRFRRYLYILEFRLRGFKVVPACGDRRVTTQPFFTDEHGQHEMFERWWEPVFVNHGTPVEWVKTEHMVSCQHMGATGHAFLREGEQCECGVLGLGVIRR